MTQELNEHTQNETQVIKDSLKIIVFVYRGKKTPPPSTHNGRAASRAASPAPDLPWRVSGWTELNDVGKSVLDKILNKSVQTKTVTQPFIQSYERQKCVHSQWEELQEWLL